MSLHEFPGDMFWASICWSSAIFLDTKTLMTSNTFKLADTFIENSSCHG
jgi:hypothetical protein